MAMSGDRGACDLKGGICSALGLQVSVCCNSAGYHPAGMAFPLPLSVTKKAVNPERVSAPVPMTS